MKSRIAVATLVFASLALLVSPLAYSQTTDTGTAPAVREPAATPAASPEAAAPATAPALQPAAVAPAAAPVPAAAPAAAEAPVPAPATSIVPATAAATDVAAAAADVAAITNAAASAADANALHSASEAATGTATGTESSAQVIELTPEEQAVPGAEIKANPENENKISVTLDNVPLQDVIRMFTRISGANIVSGTNLTGNVTVNLQDVEWEPALKVILDVVDMALVEKSDGIFAVVPKGELASEPVVSETLFLSYSTVSNILPVIQKLLIGTNASVAGFPAANALVVQETRPRLNLIKDAISKIDKPRHQVLIEAKFVELNDQAIKDLGINWQVLQGYNVRLGAPTISYNKTRTDRTGQDITTINHQNRSDSSGTIGGNSSQNTATKSSTAGNSSQSSSSSDSGSSFVSTPPDAPQVTDNNSSQASQSANQNSTASSGSDATSTKANTTINVSGRNFTDIDAAAGTIKTFPVWDQTKTLTDFTQNEVVSALGAILSADDFQLTLSALKQNSGVEIVSNPKIIVASGERAQIHVGVKQPNYETVVQPGAGNQTQSTRQLSATLPFIDTGVIMEVEPTVNTESNITVKIVPELSRILTSANTIPGEIPPIQTRRIVSQFNLESGRTVAIGGLTQTDERETVTKIPFLGDLPIIGKYLFRHTHTEKSQDEVIIFVTVAIADPTTLVQSSGIPEDGKLIYRHLARRVEENARAAEESKSANQKKPDWMSSKR